MPLAYHVKMKNTSLLLKEELSVQGHHSLADHGTSHTTNAHFGYGTRVWLVSPFGRGREQHFLQIPGQSFRGNSSSAKLISSSRLIRPQLPLYG